MMVFGVQPLALGPTVDTYVKYDQFEHFIPSKYQHFERTTCTLWSLLVQSSALKGAELSLIARLNVLARKTGFCSYSGHKTAAEIVLYFGKGGFGCDGGGAATELR